jgi:hydroxyacylglutathione hydrolase
LFFRQVLYRDLGCASYFLGDAGEAIVVDPRWDVEVYLEMAEAEHFRIAHVLDTHDHADHVSGRERLVEATGARAYRPGTESALAPGASVRAGAVELRALATPGHRPEHTAFVVSDLSRGPEPWMVLTGDSLLVGDIARPDLAVAPGEGASGLHASLAQLVALGDRVEVWPGHIGGSLCGGTTLSSKPSSTIGFERSHNPVIALDEPEFVAELTRSLPTRPPNVERIVGLNRTSEFVAPRAPAALPEDRLRGALSNGAIMVDARHPDDFDRGHLAGAVNLPLQAAGVGTRAGWAFAPEERLVIVAEDEPRAQRMASALQAVGFSNLEGFAVADPESWVRDELPVAQSGAWDVDRLGEAIRDGTVDLIDVREPIEWAEGHVEGSINLPLHGLREAAGLPNGNGHTTAVACAAGMRAAFAASLLRRGGRLPVVRVAGGGVPDLRERGVELVPGL